VYFGGSRLSLEDRTICGPIPHASVELALENTDLVSEHRDLDVPV
jgi:hypothetical protein